ncbi:ammonium transporter, partial [Klebsiella pneumoniae]|nr:ammonium transporter [Klebsiella pneumoniae]MCP6663509.1 ammonium transporter [Klebsiella pneumoniae]
VCYIAIIFAKKKLGYDDALDAFGLHGVGGIWGALLTGVFCTTTVNKAGTDGLFYGNAAQLIPQLGGVLVTIVWAGVATFLILKVISIFTPLR